MCVWDIVVIGGGAAGLSAALNACARNKSVCVLSSGNGALSLAKEVSNHLGCGAMSGAEMMEVFRKQALDAGAEIRSGRAVCVLPMKDGFSVQVAEDGEFLTAKAVVLAMGANIKASVKGEADFVGKGVSYCATCDGMLYKGRDVAVVLEEKTEESEKDLEFLRGICKTVSVFERVEEIIGDESGVTAVRAGELINCDCVFIFKSCVPVNALIKNLEVENGFIKVNENCETNLKGVFACGDCTGKPFQVSKAVGQGQIAALNV